jgi:Flp pilus assembly pilin Flp
MKTALSSSKSSAFRSRSRRGQGFVEYICLVGLIALLIFLTIKLFGNAVGNAFNNMTNAVNNASTFNAG